MTRITIRLVKKGHFATGQELYDRAGMALKPALKRAANEIEKIVSEETPKRTGNLVRGWLISEPHVDRGRVIIRMGNRVPYLRHANRRSRLNAGFVERIRAKTRQRGDAIVRDGIRDLGKELWVNR